MNIENMLEILMNYVKNNYELCITFLRKMKIILIEKVERLY